MSAASSTTHSLTTVNNIRSEDSAQKDVRSFTHPRGVNPLAYLEQVRQRTRLDKMLTLRQSLTDMIQSASVKEQNQDYLREITYLSEYCRTIHSTVLALDESDTESATRYGQEVVEMITALLFRVVGQLGQSNVRTPTFESMLAYIRDLIHRRSAHMREATPGLLLVVWYELSNLVSAIHKEPELRITKKKVLQLLDVANSTAAWAYKYSTTEWPANDADDETDCTGRNSIPYTYE